jgi:hexosaminidase
VAPDRYTGIEVGLQLARGTKDMTYRFLDEVFGELAALTPGPYLHIGGDEAKTLGPEDYGLIVARAQEIVASHGKARSAGTRWRPLHSSVPLWCSTGVCRRGRGWHAGRGFQGNQVIMSPPTVRTST